MKNIKITIQGVTPLLMCKFNAEQLTTSKKDKNMLPRELAEEFAYRLKDGELYIPGECVFAALIDAGRFHKIGKNKVTTIKSSLIPAYLGILTQYCKLGTKDFEVDGRSVVIPATGGRIMRYRPRLDSWQTTFEIDIDTIEFSEKFVRQLVDDAGIKCGLLSYRPNRKGMFGKFKVIKWDSK